LIGRKEEMNRAENTLRGFSIIAQTKDIRQLEKFSPAFF